MPKQISENVSIEQALESLMIEDADLRLLEREFSEINFFEAAGAIRSELRHSDFLAFLLDPNESHGLRDKFLRRLLQRSVFETGRVSVPVSALQLGVWDLYDCSVRREQDNIDLLIVSATNRLVIVIENKVTSREHSSQLARYAKSVESGFQGYVCLHLYLTMEGDIPSETRYIPLSYRSVCAVIDEILASPVGLSADTITILKHYTVMVRRNFMKDNDLAELARKIYAQHRAAFDYMYEQRPDQVLMASDTLKTLVKKRSDLALDDCSKSYVRFAPVEWSHGLFVAGEGWTSSKRTLLFEFKNVTNEIKLALYIGPADVTVRQILFDLAKKGSPPMKLSGVQLYAKWNSIWSKSILKNVDDIEAEELPLKLTDAWDQFLSTDFDSLKNVFSALAHDQLSLSQ